MSLSILFQVVCLVCWLSPLFTLFILLITVINTTALVKWSNLIGQKAYIFLVVLAAR